MPKPNPAAELAAKLVETVRAAKQDGTYPLTLQQLLARCQVENAPELAKALGNKTFKTQVIVAAKKTSDAPVALAADAELLAGSAALLEFAVGLLSTAKKPLHSVAKVAAKIDARLREAFTAAAERRIAANDLPPTVAAVRVKDVPHLCLQIYLPRLAPEVELAGKLLRALQDHRGRGDYPVPLDRLLHDADPQASPELVGKALAAKAFKPHALLALPKDPQTPVALAADGDQLARAPALLETVLANVSTPDNQAVPATDLAKKLAKNLRMPFAVGIAQAVAAGTLPATVGCVRIKAKSYLFLVGGVGVKPAAPPAPAVTQPPATPIDFAARFEEMFAQADRENGSHNFVNLVELRATVPVERAVFDAGLQRLRQAGRYTLSGAEGRHGITDAERAAGVNENGSLLLYVSRRR